MSPSRREHFIMCYAELPQPPNGTTLEAGRAHDKRAMDAAVALNPDNAFEAGLAVRIVATDALVAGSL